MTIKFITELYISSFLVSLKIAPVRELEEKTKSKRGEEKGGCEKIIGG